MIVNYLPVSKDADFLLLSLTTSLLSKKLYYYIQLPLKSYSINLVLFHALVVLNLLFL